MYCESTVYFLYSPCTVVVSNLYSKAYCTCTVRVATAANRESKVYVLSVLYRSDTRTGILLVLVLANTVMICQIPVPIALHYDSRTGRADKIHEGETRSPDPFYRYFFIVE